MGGSIRQQPTIKAMRLWVVIGKRALDLASGCRVARATVDVAASGEEWLETTIEEESKIARRLQPTSSMGLQHEPQKTSSSGPVVKKERSVVRYKECRKNHAANIGGYAVDGCLEFMAAGEEGTSDALRCAACNCHRSFHRREVETVTAVCGCSSGSSSRR
ncbi:hypothetical protein GW17_00054190 [Ensete ventricosum]|nr:hypothetical protein GW17_00054190 [Ensete ventricosum]